MSEQYQHTISPEWLTTFRENYYGERIYTHLCPACRYSYKDECEEGYAICPNCKKEMMQEEK